MADPRELTVETLDLSDPGGPGPTPEAPPPALPGYRIEGELGRGSMGCVYRALDLKRGRPVALKVSGSLEPDELRRIELEAELQGQLHHPAVPRILARGHLDDGRPYLAQSLVRGARPLDEAAVGASWLQKVEWVATAAEALAVAHGRCVSHGDLKPENLLVDARGRLVVIDWGVSRLAACASPAPAELSPAVAEHARRSAEWIQGTLAYMSPEQLAGDPVPASDVYSLGIVLHELLLGRHPMEALLEDLDRLVRAIRAGHVGGLPGNLPPDLVDLARRCVRTDPARRPPAVEAARVLRRLARNERRRRAETAAARP